MNKYLFLLLFTCISFGQQFNPIFFTTGFRANRNVLQKTEEFDDAYWSKSSITVSANATTAPDGTSTADKLQETAVSSQHSVSVLLSGTAQVLTLSVYAKAADRNFVNIGFNDNTANAVYGWFDLSTGTTGSIVYTSTGYSGATISIQNVGSGWYRCIITANKINSTASNVPIIGSAVVDAVRVYAGTLNFGIYIWGAQLEKGYIATPYKKQ